MVTRRSILAIRTRLAAEALALVVVSAAAHGALILAWTSCGPDPSVSAAENAARVVGWDLDGHAVAPFAVAKEAGKLDHGLVLLFVGADCPISNAYVPELRRIEQEYGPRGFAFFTVYADPAISADVVRKHRADFDLTLPALLDPEHALVGFAEATVTPEAAVFSPRGELLYRGRIDDLYVDFGKRREKAAQHDLRDALDAILAGGRPEAKRTRALGCFIPDA